MSEVNDEEIIFINECEEDNHIGLSCEVCDYLLITKEDIESSRSNQCCEYCWLQFGEMNREDWASGWRPDPETIDRYKQERSILIRDLKLKVEAIYESKF